MENFESDSFINFDSVMIETVNNDKAKFTLVNEKYDITYSNLNLKEIIIKLSDNYTQDKMVSILLNSKFYFCN